MIYEYSCSKCGKVFEEFRSFIDRNNVTHCGKQAIKLISLPNTDKDLSYNFNTDIFGGKQIQVRSKGHYKELLRQHKMLDASPKECIREGRIKKKSKEIEYKGQVKNRAKRIMERMKKENVAHV